MCPTAAEIEQLDAKQSASESLKEFNLQYLNDHPEIKKILCDFVCSVLIRKPENPLEYAKEFFAPFLSIGDDYVFKNDNIDS